MLPQLLKTTDRTLPHIASETAEAASRGSDARRQVGIRQRSLGPRCRLGRATELVFILATGVTLVLGGQAQAQVTAEWNGATSTDFSNPANYVDTINPFNNDFVLNNDGVTQPTLFGTSGAFSIAVNSVAISAGTLTLDDFPALFSSAGVVISGGEMIVNGDGAVFGDITTSDAGTLTVNRSVVGDVINGGTLVMGGGQVWSTETSPPRVLARTTAAVSASPERCRLPTVPSPMQAAFPVRRPFRAGC